MGNAPRNAPYLRWSVDLTVAPAKRPALRIDVSAFKVLPRISRGCRMRGALHATVVAAMLGPASLSSDAIASDAIRQSQIFTFQADQPKTISEEALASKVRRSDLILAGEVHDNPHHHRAQASIVRWAASDDRPVIVVFEMLNREQQSTVDEFVANGGSVREFARAVSWEERGWPSATLYQPLLEAVFAVNAEIVAGDLPQQVVRNVGQGGLDAAPATLVKRFALDRALDPGIATTMRTIQDNAHCGLIPEDTLPRMVNVQRLRDAALAEAVLEAHARNPDARIVLIAGSGHVREDHGVAALIRAVTPNTATLTVGLIEGSSEFDSSTASRSRKKFDVAWVTPPAERPDPCEKLRQHRGT